MRLLITTALLLLSFAGFSQQFYLFVGTYTEGAAAAGSKGIYVYTFDAATGELKPVSTAASTNPSYLTVAPGGKYVYAVGETHGATPGSVSAFSFDKKTGQLSFINKQESGGGRSLLCNGGRPAQMGGGRQLQRREFLRPAHRRRRLAEACHGDGEPFGQRGR